METKPEKINPINQTPPSPEPSVPEPGKADPFFNKKTIAGLVALVLLGVGGYFFVYAGPGKVWQLFLKEREKTSYTNHTTITYKDTGKIEGENNFLGMALKDFTVKLDSDSYVDETTPKFVDSSSKITYSFASGNSSFSTGVQSRTKDNVVYINIGNNPLLRMLMDSETSNKDIDWLKMDLNGLDDLVKNKEYADEDFISFYKEISNPEFKKQLEKIWTDARVVEMKRSLGSENIDGEKTYHFENAVNKQELQKVLDAYIDEFVKKLNAKREEVKSDEVVVFKKTISALLKKIEIKKFETWVGVNNGRLYKVEITANSPSFISLVNNVDGENLAYRRDETRLSGLETYAYALKQFKDDYGGYPENLDVLHTTNRPSGKDGYEYNYSYPYLYNQPEIPEKADGSCTDSYKGWVYKPENKIKSERGLPVYSTFKIYTCLGGPVETYSYYNESAGTQYDVLSSKHQYKAGMVAIDSESIKNADCPEAAETCFKNGKLEQTDETAADREIRETIDNLSFNAELTVVSEYGKYGQKQEIKVPENSLDLLQKFIEQQSVSRDYKRMSDARQLASALELYYNDHNGYPENMQVLTPNYIGAIPTAPGPADSTCGELNNYSYTPEGVKTANPTNNGFVYPKYSLTFCLGKETSGYSDTDKDGKLACTLTQAGINCK